MGAGYPADWASRSRRVKQHDNWTCQVCDRKGGKHGNAQLHAHHITPKSQGGGHDYDNLTTLCDRCHAAFHNDPRLLADSTTGGGSIWGHVMVALLTVWWTLGLGNVLYESVASKQQNKVTRAERRKRRKGVKKLRKQAGKKTLPQRARGYWHDQVDKGYNDEFGGCPSCKRRALSVRWISSRRGKTKVIECGKCGALFEEERVGTGLKLNRVSSVSEIESVPTGFDYELEKHLKMGSIDRSELGEFKEELLKEASNDQERKMIKSKMRKFERRARTSRFGGKKRKRGSRSRDVPKDEYQRKVHRAVHGESGADSGGGAGTRQFGKICKDIERFLYATEMPTDRVVGLRDDMWRAQSEGMTKELEVALLSGGVEAALVSELKECLAA